MGCLSGPRVKESCDDPSPASSPRPSGPEAMGRPQPSSQARGPAPGGRFADVRTLLGSKKELQRLRGLLQVAEIQGQESRERAEHLQALLKQERQGCEAQRELAEDLQHQLTQSQSTQAAAVAKLDEKDKELLEVQESLNRATRSSQDVEVVTVHQQRQRAQLRLSPAEMQLLGDGRSQLRTVQRLARQGNAAAARMHLLQVLDENEEVLLHVFDGALPSNYQLGLYEHCYSTQAKRDLALQQAEQLLQECEGHIIGRLGMAVLKLMTAANEDAAAILSPVPQELGPLGLFTSLQAVAAALTQADAVMAKAEGALLDGNTTAVASLELHVEEIEAESMCEHVRGTLEKLVQGHEAVIAKLPSPSARCYSLQVAGCFQAGEYLQVIEVCRVWLEKAPQHEFHLWAYTMAHTAKLNLVETPEHLSEVAKDMSAVLASAKQHPNVLLEGQAFPALLPERLEDYLKFFQDMMGRVESLARSLADVISFEDMSQFRCHPDLLVEELKKHIQDCTDLLESGEVKGLSLAATARILLSRARSQIRQRELSLGLTDLAWAFGLWPCSHEIVSLWGDTLVKLGAVKAVRDVVRLVELALRHSPLAAATADQAKLNEWLCDTQAWLPKYPVSSQEFDRETELSVDSYLWLVNNRTGVARGRVEFPLHDHKFRPLAEAFGQHVGYTMPQVFNLIKEAVKPQALLMARNRELHRPTPGGEPFEPLAFSTAEESLDNRPFVPMHMPAAGYAFMPQPSAGAAFFGGAFGGFSCGAAAGQANRPFSRPDTSHGHGTTFGNNYANAFSGSAQPASAFGTAGTQDSGPDQADAPSTESSKVHASAETCFGFPMPEQAGIPVAESSQTHASAEGSFEAPSHDYPEVATTEGFSTTFTNRPTTSRGFHTEAPATSAEPNQAQHSSDASSPTQNAEDADAFLSRTFGVGGQSWGSSSTPAAASQAGASNQQAPAAFGQPPKRVPKFRTAAFSRPARPETPVPGMADSSSDDESHDGLPARDVFWTASAPSAGVGEYSPAGTAAREATASQTGSAPSPAAAARPRSSGSRFCFARPARTTEGAATSSEDQGSSNGHADAAAPTAVPGGDAHAYGDDLAAFPVGANSPVSSLSPQAAEAMLHATDAASPAADLPAVVTYVVRDAVSAREQGKDIKLGSAVQAKGTAGRPVFHLTANAAYEPQPTGDDDVSFSSNTPASSSIASAVGAAAPQAQAAHVTGVEDLEPLKDYEDEDAVNPEAVFLQDPSPSAQQSVLPAAFVAPVVAAGPSGQPLGFAPQLPVAPPVQPTFSFGPAPQQAQQQGAPAGAQQQQVGFGPQMPAIPNMHPVPQPFSFGPVLGQAAQQAVPADAQQQQPGGFGQQAAAMPSFGSFGGFGVGLSAAGGQPADVSGPARRKGHSKTTRRGGR